MSLFSAASCSSDGHNRRIFLGLKFSSPGIFWVGKFGKLLLGDFI